MDPLDLILNQTRRKTRQADPWMYGAGLTTLPSTASPRPFSTYSPGVLGGGPGGNTGGQNSASSGNAGGSGGSTFDFKSFIENDPTFSDVRRLLSTSGIGDKATLSAQRIGVIGKAGLPLDLQMLQGQMGPDIISSLGDIGGDLAKANQLAESNTASGLSIASRIESANKDALRKIKNDLAARGALQTGELGSALRKQRESYTRTRADLSDYQIQTLIELEQGFQQGERARQLQKIQALEAARGRAADAAAAGGYSGSGTGGGGGGTTPSGGGTTPSADPTRQYVAPYAGASDNERMRLLNALKRAAVPETPAATLSPALQEILFGRKRSAIDMLDPSIFR